MAAVIPSFSFLYSIKVASFQVPMPNSPLLLNYLCFGARLITEVFIYSRILARVCAVAMATGLVKNKA